MLRFILTLGAAFTVCAAGGFGQGRGELSQVPLVVPADKLPEFDVADIQPAKDTGARPNAQFLPGGRLQFSSLPLKFMILAAWGWENDEGRVTGGPAWMNSEQFNIVAKAPPDSSIDILRLMLRAVLVKRFGLEAHIEDKVMPVYALTRGKGEPKLKPSAGEGKADCHRSMDDGVLNATCSYLTMDEFANSLRGMAPAYVDKPVVNLTDLKGQFDFKVSWTPRGALLGTNAPGGDGTAPVAPEPTAGGLTIFESVDKSLGLKLEAARHAIPVVAVDRVNRTPTEK